MSTINRQSGFTMIELMVVIAIIIALTAMTIPAVSAIRESQRKDGTRALLETINAAMAAYGRASILVPAIGGGDGPTRQLWDFNSDGLLDGDPARDEAFASGTLVAEAARAGYRGPLSMLGLTMSRTQADGQGRLVDGWKQPLRVSLYPPDSGRLQAWSTGPDRMPDSDDDGDDIKPWRTARAR